MIFSPQDLNALVLTLKLASISTALLLLVGIPFAWWLSRTNFWLKSVILSIVTLPLVLPPTVLGFYLLLALGPNGFLGKFNIWLTGQSLAFTFGGLVIGSMIYSIPFVVQPLYLKFTEIPKQFLESSRLLGDNAFKQFFTLVLPLAKSGIYTAIILAFAHTIGEFGVILMIGGNIPEETRVVSMAIYDYVETFNYQGAHRLSLFLLGVSFSILLLLFLFNKKDSSQTK